MIKENPQRALILIGITGAIVLFWALQAKYANNALSETDLKNLEKLGQYGDSFGHLSSLFSALGIAGLIATIMMQAQTFETQSEDLYKQRFEASIYELINLYRTTKDEISDFTGNSGASAISSILSSALNSENFRNLNNQSEKSDIEAAYLSSIHSIYEKHISAYFRIIYFILNKIEEDKILSNDEKNRYGNLIRGQMSSDELDLISLNALSKLSSDMSRLIIRFRIFKYMPEGHVRTIIAPHFPDQAFKGRTYPGET